MDLLQQCPYKIFEIQSLNQSILVHIGKVKGTTTLFRCRLGAAGGKAKGAYPFAFVSQLMHDLLRLHLRIRLMMATWQSR